MDRRLGFGIGSFVLLALAACGSSSGGGSSGENSGSESGSSGSGSGSSADDDASSGDDATASGSSGTGSSSGSTSTGASSGSSGRADGGTTGDAGSTTAVDVLQMHNHVNRDGLFIDSAFTETALTGKTLHVDPTFAGTLSGQAYASPLYVQNGVGGKGTFYVATGSNNVYALDETTGASAIPSVSAGTAASQSFNGGCGNITPIGIIGTPAIDLTTRLMVFDAATADSDGSIKTHTIHAWSIDTFAEKWSLDVSTISDPVAGPFVPQVQNQRSAVLIVNGIAYVTYGGHWGDCTMGATTYHGWIIGVPLNAASPAAAKSMAKEWATPASRAGMWAPGGPSSDGTSIYMATGDTGDSDDGTDWKGGYSVVRFAAGPVFTAGSTNFWHALADDTMGDDDLGGSAPVVVDAPAITPSKLIVQMGKDSHAYTLNRTNLGGESSPVGSKSVMSGDISNVAAWANTPSGTFVAMVSNGGAVGTACGKGSGSLVIAQLSATAQITTPWCASNGGGSPSITSSDGTHDMMVWSVGTDGGGAATNEIKSWDLATGTPVVTASDKMNATRHFTTPIFVHGRAIVVGDNRLFALKP
jgi:hypothetical protein